MVPRDRAARVERDTGVEPVHTSPPTPTLVPLETTTNGKHPSATSLTQVTSPSPVQAPQAPESANGHRPLAQPRVLHVLEAIAGGTLRHLLDILDTVKNVDHHVVIPPDHSHPEWGELSVNAIATEELLQSGATIHRIEMLRNPVHPKNALGMLQLRRLIKRLQPSLVHGHSSVGGAFARAAVWGTDVPDLYTPNGVARSKAILMVEKVLAHRTSRFIGVSASEGQRALNLGLTSRERLVVIPNGIDLNPPDEPYDLRQDLKLPADVRIVGTVSRLADQKAPTDFVEVCAQVARTHPDVHFLLIGAGTMQGELEAAVTAAGLGQRFHQITYLRHAWHATSQIDVFVLTSLFEGAAYSPLEAMHAGVPVVLTDVTGNTDTIEDGVSGLLFPFGDTGAMAAGVRSLLDDDGLRQKLIAGAEERVRTHFDRRVMGQRLEALYRQIALSRT